MTLAAILPPDEHARMDAVRRYDVLDTPPDGAFDRIAAMAARLFGVPIAIISVVDTDRIWFKSHHGLDGVTEIGREPGLCASAILSDEPWIVTDADQDPRTLANPLVAGEFGLRFYAGAPLTTSDGFNLGTLCVIDREPRAVSEEEAALLTDLAALVMDELELRLSARQALAETHERLRELEHLSQALQASLLPPTLPTIPGLDVRARFRPASRYEVGGDFYDVFPVDEHTWGFVIGDVRGKGPHAASRTSFARYSLRAAAIQEGDPSRVLALVNAALVNDTVAEMEPPFVTLVYARVRVGAAGATVSFASAGHPLPTLVGADGSVQEVGEPGTLLGVLSEVAVTTSTVELGPGESLLLITDGVLDSGSPERLGQHGLERLVRRHAPAMDLVVDAVHEAVMLAQRDDMAVLALTAVGRPARDEAG